MSLILDGTLGATFNDGSNQPAAASPNVLKNRIINGGMQVWQRGTSSTTGTAGYFTADRWASFITSGSGTIAQDTTSANLPSGYQYGLKFTSSGANSGCNFYQTIETLNCYDLAGKTANLSCYICGTSSRQVTIYIAYSTTVDAAFTSGFTTSAQTTVTLSSTPTLVSFSGAIPSNARTVQVIILSATTFNSTEFFSVTGVQLEVGTSATPFERRLYNQELANCQRYYTKSYDMADVPGTVNPTNNRGMIVGGLCAPNSTSLKAGFAFFPVPMRIGPTVTTWDSAGNINRCSVDLIGSSTNNIVNAVNFLGEKSFNSFQNTGVNCAAILFFYAASAEL